MEHYQNKIWLTASPYSSDNSYEQFKEHYNQNAFWGYFDYLLQEDKENNKTEEKELNRNDFQLGDVLVVKNEVDDFMDGEAVLICPGYDETDFDVNKSDKGVCVTFYNECGDCGDIETKEFTFDFNQYRKVEDVKYNVRNGIFVLQVAYSVGSNVEKDENL